MRSKRALLTCRSRPRIDWTTPGFTCMRSIRACHVFCLLPCRTNEDAHPVTSRADPSRCHKNRVSFVLKRKTSTRCPWPRLIGLNRPSKRIDRCCSRLRTGCSAVRAKRKTSCRMRGCGRVKTMRPMCDRLGRISPRSSRGCVSITCAAPSALGWSTLVPWLPEPLAEPNQESVSAGLVVDHGVSRPARTADAERARGVPAARSVRVRLRRDREERRHERNEHASDSLACARPAARCASSLQRAAPRIRGDRAAIQARLRHGQRGGS